MRKVLNWDGLPTPCYVVDEGRLVKNLEILQSVERAAGCRILLAQKAFSMYALYPLVGRYISGTTASGLFEARLGREELGKENHVFAPAYKEEDMRELVGLCDHIIFNSFAQYGKHRGIVAAWNAGVAAGAGAEGNAGTAVGAGAGGDAGVAAGAGVEGNTGIGIRASGRVSIGIRVNPECSTQEGHAIYDPCAPGSRLGVTGAAFEEGLAAMGMVKAGDGTFGLPPDMEGLHFHTLCEQDSDALVTTFRAFEEKFGGYLHKVKWLNLGGGHHITKPGYRIDRLVELIRDIRARYGVEVYLEPGEAVALNAGYLVTEVCDIVKNDMEILILDASAACHMPDVLEMPYRPPLQGGFPAGEKPYSYRLSSLTCLAGDVIGDYSFEQKIGIGDRLVFEDMAIYSMVKNNTFNGIPLPAIAIRRLDGSMEIVKEFGYEDFKGRLG